ncbi:hypothetical protein AB0E69_29775 [Kribbella sp. NPDC026611]|uniref:hypothetical protein n=1 Tax=Kribbella sp. NPDC026611 TaxID=3154911 RepID=UPI0033D781AF
MNRFLATYEAKRGKVTDKQITAAVRDMRAGAIVFRPSRPGPLDTQNVSAGT